MPDGERHPGTLSVRTPYFTLRQDYVGSGAGNRSGLKSRPDAALVLILETRSAIVDVTPLQPTLAESGNTLCCEVVLPEGTVKLSGAFTPTLLRMLLDELKGKRQ